MLAAYPPPLSPDYVRANYPILLTRRQVLEIVERVGGGSAWTVRRWKEDGLLQGHVLPGAVYARYRRDQVLALLGATEGGRP